MKDGTFKEVSGNLAFYMFGFKWMVHRRPGYQDLFDVSELSTGAGLPIQSSESTNRYDVVEAAKTLLLKHGPESTKKHIEEAAKIVSTYNTELLNP